MATAAPTQELPLFYNTLEALNAGQHGNMKIRRIDNAPRDGHRRTRSRSRSTSSRCCSATIPIVFSVGGEPVPLALMGLNEGANAFLDDDGLPHEPNIYIPAYMRRYPFLLARLRPDSDELSLCFDPTSGAVGEFEEGEALFDGDQPSEATKAVLQFCEQFETAGQRTAAFIEELKKSDLLMDGEVAIQPEGAPQPFVYRGFRMVDEEKLRELRGDELRKMNQSGMLALDLRAPLLAVADPRDLLAPGAAGEGPDRGASAGARRSVNDRAAG